MKNLWKDKPLLSAADGSLIFMLGITVTLVLQFALSYVLLPFKDNEAVYNPLKFGCMILVQGGFFATVFLYLRKRGRRPSIDFRPLKKWYNYVLSMFAAGIVMAGFILCATYFETLLFKIGYDLSDIVIDTPLAAVLAVLATVICAPIGEELLVRGALLSGQTQRVKTLPAVLLSGLAFSLMHMSPQQTVYQFFLGAAAAYLAIKAESLLPAIVLHATNNLLAVIMTLAGTTVYVAGELPTANQQLLDNPGLFIPLTIITAALAVALLFLIGKWMKRTEKTDFEADATLLRGSTLQKSQSTKEGFFLGKYTDLIIFGMTLGICAVAWVTNFITGMGL